MFADSVSQILSIRGLKAGYGGRCVLDGFSLSVQKSDRIIVSGENGSGKTTLIKCILGLVKPMGGEISLARGVSVSYCKQDFPNAEFPITAREVVEMGLWGKKGIGAGAARRAVDEALEKTGSLKLAERLFYTLSGGERQRVSLARCFCQDADLVLLDEPSSFLDSQSRTSFVELMRGLSGQDPAVLAVTHDAEIVSALGWKVVRLGTASGAAFGAADVSGAAGNTQKEGL